MKRDGYDYAVGYGPAFEGVLVMESEWVGRGGGRATDDACTVCIGHYMLSTRGAYQCVCAVRMGYGCSRLWMLADTRWLSETKNADST